MQIQRRVLYNSLRQNWLLDPELDVADWQVEDYRTLETEELFDRIADHVFILIVNPFWLLPKNVIRQRILPISFWSIETSWMLPAKTKSI